MSADHTPSPATAGLREAVEALDRLLDQAVNTAGNEEGVRRANADGATVHDALLAAHPAPPSETATEDRQGLANVERRIKAMGSCAQPADGDGDHDGCFVAECLAFVREEREAQQARDFIGLAASSEEPQP